jgi:ATPase complex subunit ATP10
MGRFEFRAKKLATPYFQDWTNMQFQEGKTFVAPAKLFRAERALYFPNMRGRTLASRAQQDITPMLRGRVSVITVGSTLWADRHVATFISEQQHPALHALLRDGGGAVQRVGVNLVEEWVKAWVVRIFMSSVRRSVPRDTHDKYFIVRRGIDDDIREATGLLNRKVGYVFLVDWDCKIRWAGSGLASAEERQSLLNGTKKLLEQWQQQQNRVGKEVEEDNEESTTSSSSPAAELDAQPVQKSATTMRGAAATG